MMKLRAENVGRMYFRSSKNTNFFYAVESLDLELEEGKITVITGRSGSGKTTLINMLCGLLTPSCGRVLLDDKDRTETCGAYIFIIRKIYHEVGRSVS